MHTYRSQMINNYLLNIDIFKGIRVIDKTCLVFDSLLVRLEGLRSSSIGPRTNIVYPLRGNSTSNKTTYKGNSMRSASVNGYILRLFHSFEKQYVFRIRGKTLIEVGVINGIYTLNIVFILVIRRMCQSTRNQSLGLEKSVNQSYRKHKDIKRYVSIFINQYPLLFFV